MVGGFQKVSQGLGRRYHAFVCLWGGCVLVAVSFFAHSAALDVFLSHMSPCACDMHLVLLVADPPAWLVAARPYVRIWAAVPCVCVFTSGCCNDVCCAVVVGSFAHSAALDVFLSHISPCVCDMHLVLLVADPPALGLPGSKSGFEPVVPCVLCAYGLGAGVLVFPSDVCYVVAVASFAHRAALDVFLSHTSPCVCDM